MKAVQISRFGAPDVLELVDVPDPRPGPGEVLVRVGAAGINYFEALMRQNRYAVTPPLPTVLGVEVAGTVEALGPGVREPCLGTRVALPLFAIGRGSGGYAEFVTAEADRLVPIPDGVSLEAATALMVQGLTALHLVRRSAPAGKTVLVGAAAGGVGSLLLQLARRAGAARVIAAASTSEKRGAALALGADAAFALEAVPRGSADIVYDMVGGAASRPALAALAPGGTLLFGALGRFALEPAEMEALAAANQAIRGFALLPLLRAVRTDLAELFDLAAEGGLAVTIGGRFPLSRAAEAHAALESRRTMGKLVLMPQTIPSHVSPP